MRGGQEMRLLQTKSASLLGMCMIPLEIFEVMTGVKYGIGTEM